MFVRRVIYQMVHNRLRIIDFDRERVHKLTTEESLSAFGRRAAHLHYKSAHANVETHTFHQCRTRQWASDSTIDLAI